MSEIEIELDGKPLKVKPNSMIIQVADEAGVYIPRFCYHKHLSIAANCRMCLVDVEKSPKALPACATPVMPGMKIFTRSPKALAAQKAVMEFLLINHPLDCPICDQGGECELQDLSMGFGSAESFYTFGKRSVKDEDIGPLIATEMTRCIQCTRCVRFGDEIAGLRELGAIGRGENLEISTYLGKAMQSEISGNVIDLCPVGALTSKPYRFKARPWELMQSPTVAAHDCLGSNLYAHTRNGIVMRMVPRENATLNQTWISDRDRFSYEGLNHEDRLQQPLIRVNHQWEPTDWQTALEFTVNGLRHMISRDGSEQLAALASPNSTLEEFYLLQKLIRALGSVNIDHRLRQVDFSYQTEMPLFPGLNGTLADIENCDVILLVGSDIQREQPMAGVRVRQAVRKGAKVIAVNMRDYPFNFKVALKKIIAPHQFTHALTEIQNEKIMLEGKKVAVLVGSQLFNHPEAGQIYRLTQQIAQQFNAMLGWLTEGANAAGAWIAGALPHRIAGGRPSNHTGLDAKTMWENSRKAYLLLNVEPEFDCANAPLVKQALEQADFVVSLSCYSNPILSQYADVILPVTPFTETAGTFVNVSGEWQKFQGVAAPLGEARPAWKVLRVLGNLFECEGFDYKSAHEISDELKNQLGEFASAGMPTHTGSQSASPPGQNDNKLSRIGEIPLYAGDAIQRRAHSLQMAQTIIEGDVTAIRIHSETARALQIKTADKVKVIQEKNSIDLSVIVDDKIPLQAAYIAGGIAQTDALSSLYGPIEIHKI